MTGLAFFLTLGLAGIALRQVDRLRFLVPRRRRGTDSVSEVLAWQRKRANDLTPTLLLAGHWMEIAAWWALAARLGPAGLVLAAAMIAVKFRHLQEVSHFAAHGVLFRRLPIGDLVTEFSVHSPLAFRPVASRRERHVRRHHPNAAVPGVDPNLDDLLAAGLGPDTSRAGFVRGVLFPLTPRGVATTARDMAANLGRDGRRGSWWRRTPIAVLVPVAAFALGGLPVLIAGYAVPRFLVYPQLSWMSLLVEHTWFEPAKPGAGRQETEADRCVRVYRNRRALEIFARCTWLPYGDLYHYAHSVHPSARWSYLPHLEAILGFPERSAPRVFFGHDSVLAKLRATTSPRIVGSASGSGEHDAPVIPIRYALRPLSAPAGSSRSAPRKP